MCALQNWIFKGICFTQWQRRTQCSFPSCPIFCSWCRHPPLPPLPHHSSGTSWTWSRVSVSSGSVWVILLQKHVTWQVLRDGPAQLRFLSPVRRVYVSVRAFPTCHSAPLAQPGWRSDGHLRTVCAARCSSTQEGVFRDHRDQEGLWDQSLHSGAPWVPWRPETGLPPCPCLICYPEILGLTHGRIFMWNIK